jgi:transcriptional regulator with PAS, ATPase and Fis domain
LIVATSVRDDGGARANDGTTEGVYDGRAGSFKVQRFHLEVVDGPERRKAWASTSDRCSIGSHPSNDLVLTDRSVSRFHCEIILDGHAARVRDLGSRNGTELDGVTVIEGILRASSTIRLGRTSLHFQLEAERNGVPLSERPRFGSLVGRSAAMRAVFAILERVAPSDASVLLEGESGTGKEEAASSVHAASSRRNGPFVVVDCGAIPAPLLESELFGHVRGAFTGATTGRRGAFLQADGGTIFLDEIGELSPELQPKLLRALASHEIQPIGSNRPQTSNFRVIAATNRDLRAAVNVGRFRSDLYFRLAVVKVTLPPLRSRPEDIPVLVEHLLGSISNDAKAKARLADPSFITGLMGAAWPGNVRELRNHLEHCLVLDGSEPGAPSSSAASLGYEEARRHAIAAFERRYIEDLLKAHGGKVAAAARAAGIDRVYLYRLIRRHGVGAAGEEA